MSLTNLQGIAEEVVQRARGQGFVVRREIREALAQAGLPETHWKDVLALAQAFLHHRHGRYYYVSVVNSRPRTDRQQREVQQAVRQIIHDYRVGTTDVERRQHGRVPFIQPTKILLPDHREIQLLSRDISPTGIRLIGTRSLQGQKVRVLIPRQDNGQGDWCFLVQILWSSQIGENLVEHGGVFLESLDPHQLKLRG
ncbi:MAG TPA: PilZ domain-containing protein [Gemmataceae bacterium]|jgi:hypothetical protein|nr:PilZ domain-containing protein [Gemmataceae bacterium]